MKIRNVLKLVFGLLFVFLIFYYIGFDRILSALKNFNLIYLLAIPPFVFLSYLGGVYNLHIFLSALNFKIRFWKLFKYYLLGLSVGMFTPGRLGEFSMIYFFRKEGIPLGKGAAISFLDKLISFIAASMVAVVALFVFVIPKNVVISLVVVIPLVLLIVIFFFFSEKGRYLINHYILRSYSKKFEGFSSVLFFFLKNKFHIVLLNFLVSIVKWFAIALMAHYVFLGFGFNVNPLYIFLITNFIAIVTLIPITFNGLGFIELSIIFFYSKINVPSNIVISENLIAIICSYTIGLVTLVIFIEEFRYIKKIFNEEFNQPS